MCGVPHASPSPFSSLPTSIVLTGGNGGPAADRRAYLTQHESTYALAIFSELKDIPGKAVTRHLKQPLRPFFRQCVKELRGEPELLERLRAISTVPEPTAAEGLVGSS